MIKKYRKKSVVIRAVQWNGNNIEEIRKFVGKSLDYLPTTKKLRIITLEGLLGANLGDFIIKGIKGEFYPCKPDIFVETYEEEPDYIINDCLVKVKGENK